MMKILFLKFFSIYFLLFLFFAFLFGISSAIKDKVVLSPVSSIYLKNAYTKNDTKENKTILSPSSYKKKELNSKIVPNNLSDKPETVYLPILTYHYIDHYKDNKDTLRRSLTTPPEVFEDQVRILVRANFKSVSLYDLLKALNNETELPTKSFVLNFDDGYLDFYTQAYQILKRYNLKAANFLILNSLELEGNLKKWQIREMFYSGLVDFGSHSLSHGNLTLMTKEKMRQEIFDSKFHLEDTLEIPIDFFAYPGGNYNNLIEELTKEAGFLGAVSSDFGIDHSQDRLYKLKRIKPGKMSGEELLKLINQALNQSPAH